jgi:SAM-dependent methyltransferase
VAGRHAEPRDPTLLGSLTQPQPTGQGPAAERLPADNSKRYHGPSALWYSAIYAWKKDDIGFYQAQAERWARPGGAVLELACGNGRVALPLARAGFRVAAVDSAADMLAQLRGALEGEPEAVRSRLEPIEQDMRSFSLDRLFRFICLPFNSMLLLTQPLERQSMLDRVREHLAPSGAFAFEIFTPDPARLVPAEAWEVDIEVDAEDPRGEGTVHVVRENRRTFDYRAQVSHIEFRTRVSRGEVEVAAWEDELDIAYIFPRELELLLERQGFRVDDRFGGPDGRVYAPTPSDVQPQFIVATLTP